MNDVPDRHTFATKDSGEREEYASGMVRDTQTGKPRFDLMLPLSVPYEHQMLTRIAYLLMRGAEKYGDRNWEKGNGDEELVRAKASAIRHFIQWFCGEVDEDHAAAVFFNVMQVEYLRWRAEHDDIPLPDVLKPNADQPEAYWYRMGYASRRLQAT